MSDIQDVEQAEATNEDNGYSLDRYRNEAAQVPSEGILGYLTAFTVPVTASAHHDSIAPDMQSRNLSTDYIRPKKTPTGAFKMAAKSLFDAKFSPQEGYKTEFEARPIGASNNINHVIHVVRDITSYRDGEKRRGDLKDTLVEMELLFKSNNYNTTGGELIMNVVPPRLPYEMSAEQKSVIHGGVLNMGAQITYFVEHMVHQQLRNMLRDYIRTEFHAFPTVASGGTYFVPQANVDELERLCEWASQHGVRSTKIPLLDIIDAREMLAEDFANDAAKRIRREMGRIAELLKSGKTIKEDKYDKLRGEISAVWVDVNEQSANLGANYTVLNDLLATSRRQMDKLVRQIETA